jgi:hypothetical protein
VEVRCRFLGDCLGAMMKMILRREVCLSTSMKMTFLDHLGQVLKRCFCRCLTLISDVLGKKQSCFISRLVPLAGLDSQKDECKCPRTYMSDVDLVISTGSSNIPIYPKAA